MTAILYKNLSIKKIQCSKTSKDLRTEDEKQERLDEETEQWWNEQCN
jgi:hypothetical protein